MKSRYKKFTQILTSLLLFLVGPICAFAQIVEIPDRNLRRALRETLNLPDEIPITQPEMLRLKRLEAPDRQIANLTGLEYASNLKWLRLQRNNISDIKPLSGLNQLEGLGLWTNPISDLSPLANLTNLGQLDLAVCHISDLTPLANLTQLEWLTLEWQRNDRITDIKPLANLTKLRHLRLHGNQIVDISPLANLVNLEMLRLDNNQIVDVSPLANLTQLKELRIDGNRIVDVSPLANLTQLTDLTLANNAITDFQPLFGLNLKNVDIDIHKLQELASVDVKMPDPNLELALREELGLPESIPLTQLVMNQLTTLDASDSQIANLTGLEHATNLKRIDFHRNNISNLKPLAELIHLERLALWDNPISDLSPLANLTKLRGLDLGGCQISDITPLANLTQLEWLTLHWQQNYWITDITPLANLTQLKELRIDGNRIVDISPLANLTMLEELRIDNNWIVDYSPLNGLSLTRLDRDENCELPDLPIEGRIEKRNFPSIFQAWGGEIINRSTLSREDRLVHHDLYWHGPGLFSLHWQETSQGYQLMGSIEQAIARRDALLAKNPNMLFLAEIRLRDALYNQYPEDWPYWLRDEAGNLVGNADLIDSVFLIDFTLPGAQDIVVQQAIAVKKCGLFDGIFFDWWNENRLTLANFDWSEHYSTPEEELKIKLSLIRRIRAAVPDDFLIIGNNNQYRLPMTGPYMNGSFMESFQDYEGGYTPARLAEIESNLLWLEENLKEPQINCLEGWGIPTEPPDSPANRRWMRFFTTMSLTLSDGYVLYNVGWEIGTAPNHKHLWYPFWDADLGQPIGPTAQRYQGIEGLYIREFDNGWVVYNRSGNVQEISLPENATGVASGQTGKAHQLPDLDGEIYLKTVAGQPTSPYDLNMDGVVNVLDLILTAQNLGSTEGDINGDGITNILDLILVAQHLGETSTPAAPAALHVSLSPETVQKWIGMAYAQNDGSVIFAQGIAMLERLLALMIPDKTVLRANYPNPFNPETWIPYHLASETEVRISIYDLRGVLVRQFNLGHQKAGYYTDRRKAVYWDGRNEIGEPVSSGIYFYTLTTDDYTGTRRMVILK